VRVETQLRAITWQVGRTGVLTPVAELRPVQLGGATVARASLFNRDEIVRLGLHEGDFVFVEKAGEIIPAIAGANVARRPGEARPCAFPAVCPVCQTKLAQQAGETALRCPNYDCPAQVRRRVEYFASAACVGIAGLGPATVEKLVAKGWVKNVADLYRLRREDLLTLGANVGTSTDRLLAAIGKSKRAELWRVIRGLGIPQVGVVASRELARHLGGLQALAEVQRNDLFPDGRTPVAGLSEMSATAVLEYFAQPKHREMVEDLRALGVRPSAPAARSASEKP
jgi:DNA ligase (NAD+)